MSLTCPQHRRTGPSAMHRHKDAEAGCDQAYSGMAEEFEYDEQHMPNGEATKARKVDKTGMLCATK